MAHEIHHSTRCGFANSPAFTREGMYYIDNRGQVHTGNANSASIESHVTRSELAQYIIRARCQGTRFTRRAN